MFCIVFCHESLNLEDFVVLLVHLTCRTKPEMRVCQFIFIQNGLPILLILGSALLIKKIATFQPVCGLRSHCFPSVLLMFVLSKIQTDEEMKFL